MKDFVQLYRAIDGSTKTNDKIAALVSYFEQAADDDKLWMVAIFSHRRPPRAVTTTLLRLWAGEWAGIAPWLFEDTYHIVGDLAETIALVTPEVAEVTLDSTLTEIVTSLQYLKPLEEEAKKAHILEQWSQMDREMRFIYNKLITGGFRVGVSQKTITKALAIHLQEDENAIAHRLMGQWSPNATTWQELLVTKAMGEDDSRPYPFCLAYALEGEVHELGDPKAWSAEWKWDGIRGQLIKRGQHLFIWTRGEELVTEKYPEFDGLLQVQSPSFVLDGELIPMQDGRPMSFADMQKRIGRKSITKKMLSEIPVYMIAYDLLELDGQDLREWTYEARRAALRDLVHKVDYKHIVLSEEVAFNDWDQLKAMREQSRDFMAEGLMLKDRASTYKVGRKKGEWWKWKLDPYEVDAVMLYAQRGHGRRANLFTDFTFAVWDGPNLVPFAKAYSGLTDDEFRAVSNFVRKNTLERFGPVHSVPAELVFTIAFEGISLSSRHKSGVALRFPRISRWRQDKSPQDADTLATLMQLLD